MGKVSKIDGLETAIGEVKKNLEGLDAIKQSLTALETKLNEPRVTSSNGNPSGNANNNPNIGGGTSAEPDLDWVLEPAKATESTVSRLVGPLINATAEMRAQMNYNNFAGGSK
jgi:hypothetical protein